MIEPEKFNLQAKQGDIARYKREVKTPMPAGDTEKFKKDYTTEGNPMWAYRAGRHWIKAHKVSDRGWSVWCYKEGENGLETDERLGSSLNPQNAQRLAMQAAHQVV